MAETKPPYPRRSRARFLLFILVLAVGMPIPLVATLARLGGHPLPAILLPVALTAAFLKMLTADRAFLGAPSPARLMLVLWPFFLWWTLAFLFAIAAPLALLLRAIALPISSDAALAGALLAALFATGLSVWHRPRTRARDVFIAGLPEAFDGYRVAQISDLHCGPFVSGARVDRWVAAVNRLDADLVAVTGDLIANGSAYVPVVAASLGKLRAKDGVYACMGNHDYFTDGDAVAHALERAGLNLLRNRGVEIPRGPGSIYLAGVDDTWTGRSDLERTLAGRPAGMPTVLLAHDPALFPEAAARGVDLTLSGHTHGGQLGLPMFAKRFNLARIMTRFTTDLYQLGAATLYVNRGLGTTGPPIRLAVAPEIAVLTLRCPPNVARDGLQPVTASLAAE